MTGDDGGAAAAPADAERDGQHVNVSQKRPTLVSKETYTRDAERDGQHVNVSQNVSQNLSQNATADHTLRRHVSSSSYDTHVSLQVTADQYIEEFTWTAPSYIIDMKGVSTAVGFR